MDTERTTEQVPDLLAALQRSLDAAKAARRTEAEARQCSQDGCPGDGRYQPPGKGHRIDCQHDAVRWCWEEVTPPGSGSTEEGRRRG